MGLVFFVTPPAVSGLFPRSHGPASWLVPAVMLWGLSHSPTKTSFQPPDHAMPMNPIHILYSPARRCRILLYAWVLLLFGLSATAMAQPDTVTNRYATAADAAYWPNVNEGDYIFFSPTGVNDAIYAHPNNLNLQLGLGKKILIWAGNYTRIDIDGTNCQNTAAQPTVITNFGGQVRWGHDESTWTYRTFNITGFDHVHLTGQYDPVAQTGDAAYKGHDGGAAMGSGDYYEKYGFWGHQRWSGERVIGNYPNVLRIQNFKTCKVDYVATWGGGFAGFNIKSDNPAVPEKVVIDIQDCFAGFSNGEGFYLGKYSPGPDQDVTELTLRNNILVFTGTEAIQCDSLAEGSVIENNVIVGSAMTFRDPFQSLYQQSAQQISFVEGDIQFRNNIIIGGMGTMQTIRERDAGPLLSDPDPAKAITFENNYIGIGRSMVNFIFEGGGVTPYEFINNLYGPVDVPQSNDAYVNLSQPTALQSFGNQSTPILVQGNRYDPGLADYEFTTGDGSNITGVANEYGYPAIVKFMDLGFEDGVDLRRFSRWSATYGTDGTFGREGEYITYEAGDVVIWYDQTGPEAGVTKMYICLETYTGSAGAEYEPTQSPGKWQQLTWNGRNLPPFDVRMAPDTYYNYRGMGLSYNPPNQNSPDLEAPVITLADGDISVEKGTSFTYPGFTAQDNVDGDVSSLVAVAWVGPALDINQIGTYILRYDVEDNAGNRANTQYRFVTVSDPNITYGTVAQVSMHRNGPVSLPDWTDLGNTGTGLQYGGVPTNTVLYDTNGAATGWHMLIDDIDNGYSEHGQIYTNSVGRDIGPFPASVTRQGIKIRNPHENPCVFVLTGLDPTKYYEVQFTGYKEGAAGDLEATLIDLGTGDGDTIRVEDNQDMVGLVANAKPDATGRLDLQFTTETPAGQPNISGLIITEKSGYGFPPTIMQTPYGGVAHAVPGRIEAEDYDEGGAGLAYHDATAGNQPNRYRTDDVDVGNCNDVDGGYLIGWIDDGEWVEYTVEVSQAGLYDLHVRTAQKSGADRVLDVTMNGGTPLATLAVPTTGDWQVFTTITASSLYLDAGQHVLRFHLNSGYNFNWFELVAH